MVEAISMPQSGLMTGTVGLIGQDGSSLIGQDGNSFTADDRGDRDQDHDYGWIGLLGLAGLGGLMRKKHDDRHDTTGGRTDVRR